MQRFVFLGLSYNISFSTKCIAAVMDNDTTDALAHFQEERFQALPQGEPPPGPLPGGAMSPWQQLIIQIVFNSIPLSHTLGVPTHRQQLPFWLSPMEDFWPLSAAMVPQYLASLREQGLALKTMATPLAATSVYSKAHGYQNPCCSFATHRATEGWKRLSPCALGAQ